MYRSARDAFGWTAEGGHFGNFRPYGLGRQMVREAGRVLSEVRVYTGIHTPKGNTTQNAAMQRRMAAWVAEQPEVVQVFPRPLRYARGRAEEKGVDVELAIDIVSCALDDRLDVVVLASGDTDLVPALQFVAVRLPEKAIVTLGYEPAEGYEADTPAALDLPTGGVERRLILRRDFDRIADKRNFYQSLSDQRGAVDPERWGRITRRFDQ